MPKKILVVDDEKPISDIIKFNLTKEGFDVDTAYDGEEAVQKVDEYDPDLMILDLMLPKKDGLEVAREVRQTHDMPIIMVTAKDTEIDKVLGLEMGADDYVTKPFSNRELVARVKANLRRRDIVKKAEAANQEEPDKNIKIGNLLIMPDAYIVEKNGKKIELTHREFELLYYLAQHMGQVMTREHLLQTVWGYDYFGESRNNTEAFIAYSTIKTIYAKGDDAGSLEFTIKNLKTREDNKQFEKNYRASINNNHQAAPDDERTIWLWNRYMDNIQMNQGIAIMQTALWIVGLFTLLSGIVGVSNIMLITVKERTREFGVRKAIGAKPWSILKLIITESIIITSFFGYIGMVCGVAANEIMDATIGHTTIDTGLFKAAMFVNPTVGIGTCIGATITIVIAGTIAGLIPAIKAARIRPIEALRAE